VSVDSSLGVRTRSWNTREAVCKRSLTDFNTERIHPVCIKVVPPWGWAGPFVSHTEVHLCLQLCYEYVLHVQCKR